MDVLNVQVAIVFELDTQIVFTLGERLKQAQKSYSATLQLLNVPPQAPPEAPRLLFLAPAFNANIGLNRMDMMIFIPDQVKSNIDSCLDYCYKTTTVFAHLLLNEALKYQWCGVITTLNYPAKDGVRPSIKTIERILPYITKIDSHGRDIASFNFQIGFKEPPYFKNITLHGYDLVNMQFPVGENSMLQQIKPEEADIEESGISILVDINNIPQKRKGLFIDDFSGVIEKNKSSAKSILAELNLGGIIDA
jgi:hypothetical protein